ncbi:hypothetical protein HanOQP8_Chr01g0010741 [Helianthus annuus]|nr:hypothetical protein HanOQP8_Chr01g0010741 [Helianthus annuus]
MWVSALKKRDRFRIGMGFGRAQVSGQDGLQHETGFGSERFEFELSFGQRRVLARGGFWIGTGRFGLGFGPTRVSARNGFRIATCFRPTRVSARDEFRLGFVFLFRFCRFFRFHFGQVSILSVFLSQAITS